MVPCTAKQDCVLDKKLDHKSELLAVTASLDLHWYSVSGCAVNDSKPTSPEHSNQHAALPLKVELLAVLKKTELCTKLRKLDFRKFSVSFIILA